MKHSVSKPQNYPSSTTAQCAEFSVTTEKMHHTEPTPNHDQSNTASHCPKTAALPHNIAPRYAEITALPHSTSAQCTQITTLSHNTAARYVTSTQH